MVFKLIYTCSLLLFQILNNFHWAYLGYEEIIFLKDASSFLSLLVSVIGN